MAQDGESFNPLKGFCKATDLIYNFKLMVKGDSIMRMIAIIFVASIFGFFNFTTISYGEAEKRIFVCDCTSPEGCPCTEESSSIFKAIEEWGEENGVVLLVKRGKASSLPPHETGYNSDENEDKLTAAKNKKSNKKSSIVDILGCEIKVKVELNCSKD